MKLNSFDDIYLVSDRVVPVSKSQLDRAEAALNACFPPGYDDFMLKFGRGDFSGYLRPYDPKRIVKDLGQNRELLAPEFWDDGDHRLSFKERTSLVPFADTIDSDLFAFAPLTPSEIFVFPRQDSRIFKLGPTFLDVLNWTATSGELVQPFAGRFFQPWNGYASLRLENPTRALGLDEMKNLFAAFGAFSHLVARTENNSLDFFIRKYGAHLSYLVLGDYTQFVIRFDSESSSEFLRLLEIALAGKGFRITEHNHLQKLPDLA